MKSNPGTEDGRLEGESMGSPFLRCHYDHWPFLQGRWAEKVISFSHFRKKESGVSPDGLLSAIRPGWSYHRCLISYCCDELGECGFEPLKGPQALIANQLRLQPLCEHGLISSRLISSVHCPIQPSFRIPRALLDIRWQYQSRGHDPSGSSLPSREAKLAMSQDSYS